jgi:hypothetical protein
MDFSAVSQSALKYIRSVDKKESKDVQLKSLISFEKIFKLYIEKSVKDSVEETVKKMM